VNKTEYINISIFSDAQEPSWPK